MFLFLLIAHGVRLEYEQGEVSTRFFFLDNLIARPCVLVLFCCSSSCSLFLRVGALSVRV